MPRKQKMNVGLAVRAGEVNLAFSGIPKEYTELYNEIKTVDNSNTPLEVFKFADSIAGDSLRSAKQLVLANVGHAGLEIQLKYDAWTNGTPDANGSAVYTNFLLGCGEYISLNSTGIVNFDENTSAANAASVDNNTAYGLPDGYIDSGADLDGAHNDSTTTLTTDSSNAYLFKAGDYLFLAHNDVTTGPEIMKVVSVNSATALTVERGALNTKPVAHDNNDNIYFLSCNLTPNLGGMEYQRTYKELVESDALNYKIASTIAKVEGSTVADTITDTGSDLGLMKIGRSIALTVSGATEKTYISKQVLESDKDTLYAHVQDDLDAVSAGTATLITSVMNTTNQWGQYTNTVFPGGTGRSANQHSAGLVPGSVAIKFAIGGRAKFGLQNAGDHTDSGLTYGQTYRFSLECDGRKETIEFRVGKDRTMGAIIGLIHDALADMNPVWDDEFNSPRFYWQNNDLCVHSPTNIHTLNDTISTTGTGNGLPPKSGVSTVILSDGTAGNSTQLFGSGIFPRKAPINEPSYYLEDKIVNEDTGEYELDTRAFMFDDGNGNLYVTSDTLINLCSRPGAGWVLGPYSSTVRNAQVVDGGGTRAYGTRDRLQGGEHEHHGGAHAHDTSHRHEIFYNSDMGPGWIDWPDELMHRHTIQEGDSYTGYEGPIGPWGGGWNYTTAAQEVGEWGGSNHQLISGESSHGHDGGGHSHHPTVAPWAGRGDSGPPRIDGMKSPSNGGNKIYTGKVNYETGALWIGWGPETAEFAVSATYNSAFSGTISTTAAYSNGIQSIYARSANQKTNGQLRIVALR